MWEQCDAVIMLTYSNWATEMRSNRYHYATRFSKHKPVFFVQPTGAPFSSPQLRTTTIPNLYLLEISPLYTRHTFQKMSHFFQEKCRKPLLWVYNHHFKEFIDAYPAALKIYHATEDYFSTFFPFRPSQENLQETLKNIDLLIAVSEGVAESYQKNGLFNKKILTLTNGCDYTFWSQPSSSPLIPPNNSSPRILYQGNIHHKVHFSLLLEVISQNPFLEFWFCGAALTADRDWKTILQQKNVKFWGKLTPDEVRDLAHLADIGIIPFTTHDAMVDKSFPLKAFEYIAANLPVVSTPIRSLKPFHDVILFAETAQDFSLKIQGALQLKQDSALTRKRAAYGQNQDYTKKFQQLIQELHIFKVTAQNYPPVTAQPITLIYLFSLWSKKNFKIIIMYCFHQIFSFLSLEKREILKITILKFLKRMS